ncbi:MAG: competence/damage-inducible protein A [Deltaproteobacteria bacterium]|nr:competence/damage-inducible protein A [Deltaproteobacteria bacterium]
MKIAIMTIGDELTSGFVQDANGSFIARRIREAGWRVTEIIAVGDEETTIVATLHRLARENEAVIVTGGLGPTADDKTTAAVARAAGKNLCMDDAVLALLKERFERLRLRWTDNNAKQALFPEGSEILPNPAGSAAGFAVGISKAVIVVVPGVPREAERMIVDGALPLLRRAFGDEREVVISRTIKLFGRTESQIDAVLAGMTEELSGVMVGSYPQFPEIYLRITAWGTDSLAVTGVVDGAVAAVREKLGKYIFGYDDDTIAAVIGRLLVERGGRIAVAESCTGGLITDRLTDVPGSSSYLERGLVVYSNEAKMQLLGVSPETIEVHGAVSAETAREMAAGVRRVAGVDYGCATTGIAGPSGDTEGKPVGTVFVAVAGPEGSAVRRFAFGGERRRIKELTARWTLESVRRFLTGVPIDEE